MTTTPESEIAANVRAEVARRRARQDDLRVALGLNSQQQVSNRLNGYVAFSAAELKKLADFLEIPVERLYGEEVTA